MKEFVFLVAFTIEGETRDIAETRLSNILPMPGYMGIESWWIAEDSRHDGSDNDSAVFVTKGYQWEAWRNLMIAGLSATHNTPFTALREES